MSDNDTINEELRSALESAADHCSEKEDFFWYAEVELAPKYPSKCKSFIMNAATEAWERAESCEETEKDESQEKPGIKQGKLLTLDKSNSPMNCNKTNVNVKSTSPAILNNELYIDLSTVPLTEPQYCIADFLPFGAISMIYGNGGQGKSYLALYLAVLVSAGRPFLNMAINKGKVLYCDYELSQEIQRQRLERICNGLTINASSLTNSLFYLAPGTQDNVPPNLTKLIPIIKKGVFDLIIIDSIGAALTGDPEAARDICPLFQNLRELGTVVLTDHQPKLQKGDKASEKTPFGSVYKFNLSRNVWHLNAKQDEVNKLKCMLKHTKSNFSGLKKPIGLEFDFANDAFKVKQCELGFEFAEHLGIKEQIIMALEELGKATAEEIAEEAGQQLNSVKSTISTLIKDKKVEKTGEKKGRASIYQLSKRLNVKNKEVLNNVNLNVCSINDNVPVQTTKVISNNFEV